MSEIEIFCRSDEEEVDFIDENDRSTRNQTPSGRREGEESSVSDTIASDDDETREGEEEEMERDENFEENDDIIEEEVDLLEQDDDLVNWNALLSILNTRQNPSPLPYIECYDESESESESDGESDSEDMNEYDDGEEEYNNWLNQAREYDVERIVNKYIING